MYSSCLKNVFLTLLDKSIIDYEHLTNLFLLETLISEYEGGAPLQVTAGFMRRVVVSLEEGIGAHFDPRIHTVEYEGFFPPKC